MPDNFYREIAIVSSDIDFIQNINKVVENLGYNIVNHQYQLEKIAEYISELPTILILDCSSLSEEEVLNAVKKCRLNSVNNLVTLFVYLNKMDKLLYEKLFAYGRNELFVAPINNCTLVTSIKKSISEKKPTRAVIFEKDQYPVASIEIRGELVKISENSCLIDAPIKFQDKENVNIKSELLTNIGHDNSVKYLSHSKSKYVERKSYQTKFVFKGNKESSNEKIRSGKW